MLQQETINDDNWVNILKGEKDPVSTGKFWRIHGATECAGWATDKSVGGPRAASGRQDCAQSGFSQGLSLLPVGFPGMQTETEVI